MPRWDRTRSCRCFLLGVLLALAAAPGYTEIYKCTDAEGRITFDDEECGSNAEVIQLDENTTTGVDLRLQGEWSEKTDTPGPLESGPDIERYQRLLQDLMDERNRRID